MIHHCSFGPSFQPSVATVLDKQSREFSLLSISSTKVNQITLMALLLSRITHLAVFVIWHAATTTGGRSALSTANLPIPAPPFMHYAGRKMWNFFKGLIQKHWRTHNTWMYCKCQAVYSAAVLQIWKCVAWQYCSGVEKVSISHGCQSALMHLFKHMNKCIDRN